jgi:hypothetical protein
MKIIKEIKWFFKQLKRSLAYFKHSWGGYDWDYGYSVDMFKYSLQRLHDNLNSRNAYSIDSKQQAMRLKTIIELMEKVYNEGYGLEYQDKLEKMYGKDVLNLGFEAVNDEEFFSVQYQYKTRDNADEIDKTHKELFALSQEKQERAHKLLWKLVEHNIRNF